MIGIRIKKLFGRFDYYISFSGERLIRTDMVQRRSYTGGRSVVERRFVQVVKEIPDKLRGEISSVASQYSREANQLDSTFPKRLFDEKRAIESGGV